MTGVSPVFMGIAQEMSESIEHVSSTCLSLLLLLAEQQKKEEVARITPEIEVRCEVSI